MTEADTGRLKGDKIVRSENPLNLEMPFEQLNGFITATGSFYVRCHFPIPKIDKQNWRLRVEGKIERPFELSYQELVGLPCRTIPATLECAGNARSFLEPKVKGVPWGLGAVGNAEWTGVPLSALLDRAGVRDSATEIIFEGADRGALEEGKKPSGDVNFARSIPLEKARHDVLLAYKMNGAELPAEHGFPLRAIVPGWYAVASIKWLQRIIITDKPFRGYYQTIDYSYWTTDRDNLPELVPIRALQVKAQIARPQAEEAIAAGSTYPVRGAAWSGDAEVTKIEVSVDGGKSWENATLLGPAVSNAWRLWEFKWEVPPKPGRYTLTVRATDSNDAIQPGQRDPDRGTYMINHLLRTNVEAH